MALIYIVTSILPYGSSYILGELVNSIVAGTSTGIYEGVGYLLVLYSLASGFPTLLSNFRSFIVRKWQLIFSDRLEIYMFRIRESIDIGHLENPKFQDLLQRAYRQGDGPVINTVRSQLNFLWDVSSFIVGTILAVHFNLWIYLIVILSAVPGFIVDLRYARKDWNIWSKDSPEQRRFADLRHHIYGKMYLIETKLLQSGERLINQMESIISNFSNIQIGQEKNKTWLTIRRLLFIFFHFSSSEINKISPK